jgi:ribosomal protein L29
VRCDVRRHVVYLASMSKQNKTMEDFRNKSPDELKKLLAEQREALREFRFGMKGSKTRDTKAGLRIRKDIARILFLLGSVSIQKEGSTK